MKWQCPACGSTLSSEQESEGLCLACLMELALESPSLLAELDDEAEATLAFPDEGTFATGSILGERYRVRALLGRGGMGEVWRAFDLKLRVDVALKAVRSEWVDNERALETLRQEVRSARQVMSPNVCRIFDLIEIDGRELVSMEYVDGITLLDILRIRAPLDLTEAREIASQFLAGLEAIHDAGLVHRDVKPENIMMTRSGRVVVMDFGIAKGLAEGRSSTISGTPAYMPPEQSMGQAVTSRSDVFSAGIMLAEMVAPEGLRTLEARQRIWEGAHRNPPEVPDTAWAAVVTKAIAPIPEQRYPSASTLARALDEVTLRAAGDEDLHPYPGLASFTENDSEYFFGRELEVEEMWKKLQRLHLLGLIGPSGAGKSSFLRAGLLATIPTGWRAAVTTPEDRPFVALGQALADELVGDQEALRELPRIGEPDVAVDLAGRWRRQHDEVLLIVDQFEELFTQNPSEVQARFADLLGRLAVEANVHVLLSMRDDFLFHCSEQLALSPMYSELTPLRPPVGAALRRALVQPALKCGYRFEDEELIDEMVAEVGSERGALPLLAFAAARLWDRRDREQGLLTREAYEHIGGVGGALAQHAEATLERVGQARAAVVRELFRNLVTAQGTRAVRDYDDLFSVFSPDQRDSVATVLEALVDARLLVSYEAEAEPARTDPDAEEAAPQTPERRRIEIAHESLLTKWPRLVRWRTQDEEGAQLRDQLRQAAQLWQERGQPDDLLWTGTSFKEYELWRDRYEGGLSGGEEQFTQAMATRAARQKRRRRLAVAVVLTLAVGVAAVTGSLWRRSEAAREQAVVAEEQARDEARRAEASKLLALARLELDVDVTTALAYATASLALADTPEARQFALRALATSPPVTVLRESATTLSWPAFSPEGEWMALSRPDELEVVSRDGANRRTLGSFPRTSGFGVSRFSPEGDTLLATKGGEVRIWSVPGFEQIHARQIPVPRDFFTGELQKTTSGLFLVTIEIGEESAAADFWPLLTPLSFDGEPGETMRLVGIPWAFQVDPSGRRLAYKPATKGSDVWNRANASSEVWVRSLHDRSAPPRLLGRHEAEVRHPAWHPNGESLAVLDTSGQIRLWSSDAEGGEPLRILDGVEGTHTLMEFDELGEQLVVFGQVPTGYRYEVWDLSAPVEARPAVLTLQRSRARGIEFPAMTPDGRWLTTSHLAGRAFWPIDPDRELVLAIPGEGKSEDLDVAFTDPGRLVSTSRVAALEWDLSPGGRSRVLAEPGRMRRVAADPAGRFIVGTSGRSVVVVPRDGGPVRTLQGTQNTWAVALDAEGRRVAAASMFGDPEIKVIRIWDLESGAMRTLEPVDETVDGLNGKQTDFEFLPGDRLVSVGPSGLRLWDTRVGTSRVLAPSAQPEPRLAVFDDGRQAAYTSEASEVGITDLDTGSTRVLSSHGSGVGPVAVDATGAVIVTGSADGTVRVGPITGEEPHLLLGHEGQVRSVAISPDGTRIASIADDHTIRVWPMPDLSTPPVHTLAHEEFLTWLRSLTNVRVVEDEESSTGWTVAFDPFPGWEKVPIW